MNKITLNFLKHDVCGNCPQDYTLIKDIWPDNSELTKGQKYNHIQRQSLICTLT